MKQVFFILLVISSIQNQAQKLSAEQYISKFVATAVYEMDRSGIPASITLAQGLLESGNGNSPLAATANNHFGIKCHTEWTGDRYYQDDDEKNECFRYYLNADQSYQDHTDFLMTRSRYAFLFEYAKTDYTSWAKGLKQAGYATNPQYPSLLIDLINKYSLHQYDLKTIADYPEFKMELIKPDEVVIKEPVKEVFVENKEPISTNNKTGLFKEEIVVPIEEYYGESFLVNNIKAFKAKKEDTPLSIANKYNVPLNYLYKYNDLLEGENFIVGNYIYLQPKRNKGYAKYHKVISGENMYAISQSYGVKLKDLYEKNLMTEGEEPKVGEIIYLRDINPIKPKTLANSSIETMPTIITNTSSTNKLSSQNVEQSIQEKSKINSINNNSKEVKIANIVPVDLKIKSNDNVSLQSNTSSIESNIEGKIISKTTVNTYEVKPGDTVYNISKKFGVNVNDIIEWNHIENYDIKLGQILKLSQEEILK